MTDRYDQKSCTKQGIFRVALFNVLTGILKRLTLVEWKNGDRFLEWIFGTSFCPCLVSLTMKFLKQKMLNYYLFLKYFCCYVHSNVSRLWWKQSKPSPTWTRISPSRRSRYRQMQNEFSSTWQLATRQPIFNNYSQLYATTYISVVTSIHVFPLNIFSMSVASIFSWFTVLNLCLTCISVVYFYHTIGRIWHIPRRDAGWTIEVFSESVTFRNSI